MELSSSVNHDSQILNKLDDVCIKKVFILLQLRGLCNAADVCKRFKVLAKEVFETVYVPKPILDVQQLIESDKDFHDQWFMVRWLAKKFMVSAERLFRNFGQFMTALRLTGTGEMGGMDENQLLTLVHHYCSTSLKELRLLDVGKFDEFSPDLLVLFGGLEKLSIFADGVGDSFIACLADCNNLKHLNAGHVSAKMWINHKFPKLEILVISNNSDFDNTDFESFLEHHRNLSALKYVDNYIVSDFFAIVSKATPKLETLHCIFDEILDYDDRLEEVEENILQLSKLKSLKRLTFTCDASNLNLLVSSFEKEDTPIEYLNLVDCEIESDLIVALSELKLLKTLKLTRCKLTKETLIDVNKHLTRLHKIVIEDAEGLDLDGHKSFAENVCVVNSLKTSIESQPNLDQNSSAILSVLNDDCLVEIFKIIPLSELCNVADVCKRFQQNAQKAFQSSHHTSFESSELTKDNDFGFVYIDMRMAEQLFRNFGFFIKELKVEGRFLQSTAEQENIMFLATKYCISMSFETLTLNQINIDVEMRWIFLPLLDMFNRLPRLEIHYWCRLNKDFGKFLSICKISSIQVFSPYGSWEWMNHTFWHLQRMILMDFRLPESTMDEFIKLNGHLRSLIIHRSNLSSKIFKTVADHMPNLEEFTFMGRNPRDPKTRKNVLHLAGLKSLTKLSLNCSSFSVKNLVDELTRASTPI